MRAPLFHKTTSAPSRETAKLAFSLTTGLCPDPCFVKGSPLTCDQDILTPGEVPVDSDLPIHYMNNETDASMAEGHYLTNSISNNLPKTPTHTMYGSFSDQFRGSEINPLNCSHDCQYNTVTSGTNDRVYGNNRKVHIQEQSGTDGNIGVNFMNNHHKKTTLVPFTNTNIFDTNIQFYIEDAQNFGDMHRQIFLNNENDNSNKDTDTTPPDPNIESLVDLFNHRITEGKAPEPISVVNLSGRTLTNTEIRVLSYGKGFCPTLGEPNMGEIKSDMDRLHSICRKRFFFQKLEQERQPSTKSLATSTSTPDLLAAHTNQPASGTLGDGLSVNLLKEKIFRKSS